MAIVVLTNQDAAPASGAIAQQIAQAIFTTEDALSENRTAQARKILEGLQRGTIDGRYFVSRRVAVGLVYWFDKYRVDDFALSPVASLAQPATATPTLMMLGYFYRPYTANSLMVRLTYLW